MAKYYPTRHSFLVAWRSPGGVQAQAVDADSSLLGLELKLNSTESEVYATPSLSGALNGRFVVTWDTEYDPDSYGYVRRARLLRTAPLFRDGFESGDTSTWSTTVPSPARHARAATPTTGRR